MFLFIMGDAYNFTIKINSGIMAKSPKRGIIMKNRLISLLLALVIFICCFAGCREDKKSNITEENLGISQDSSTSDNSSEDKSDSGHKHADANADEKCDICSQSVVVLVDFYVLNDLHGKFCDTDSQIGVDEMATYLRQAQNVDDHAVFFASGDMWQGSGESNLTSGAILIEWMNSLNFTAMTLGNHEFDWGEDVIRKNKEIAEFPFLAINVYNAQTGKLADYCTPSVTVQCGDVKVGIIGAIGDCYSSISGDHTADIRFKVGSELTELVKAEADRLRSQGVDLIVYSIHDGHGRGVDSVQTIGSAVIKSYYDTALSEGYVDVVFEAHSHQRYVLIDDKGIYHIQAGGENYGLSHIEIKVNTVTGANKVTDAAVVNYSVYQNLEDDETTEEIEKKYAQTISYAYDVLGRVDKIFDSNTLADLMSKYYLDIAMERWGNKYDIVLGGGFIKTRSPYDMVSGTKTYADVMSLFPFDNRLVLCSISGAKLLDKFINSSNSNYHITLSEYGKSILGNIDRNKTYYIMTDSYSSTYASNGLKEVEEYDRGVFPRDLLAAALKRGEFEMKDKNYKLTSISDAIAMGKNIGAGKTTADMFDFVGIVETEPHSIYGDFYLSDGNGNSIYVYGLYDSRGRRYDAMTTKLKIGDKVMVNGPIMNYVNANTGEQKIEIKNATFIEKIS